MYELERTQETTGERSLQEKVYKCSKFPTKIQKEKSALKDCRKERERSNIQELKTLGQKEEPVEIIVAHNCSCDITTIINNNNFKLKKLNLWLTAPKGATSVN